jgi:hypothetical protein
MNERSFIVNTYSHACAIFSSSRGAARCLFRQRAPAVATALRAGLTAPCSDRPAAFAKLRRAGQAGGYERAAHCFKTSYSILPLRRVAT